VTGAVSRVGSRLWIVALVVVLFGGAAVAISQISGLHRIRIDGSRTPVPGVRDVSLSPGRYVVYYEVDGGGSDVSTAGVGVAITPLGGGAPVPVQAAAGSGFLDSLGVGGRAIYAVRIPRSSTYRITVSGAPPPESAGGADVVLGVPIGHRIQLLIIGGLVALLALLALAVILGAQARRPPLVGELAIGD
jgi:hypothetical protein